MSEEKESANRDAPPVAEAKPHAPSTEASVDIGVIFAQALGHHQAGRLGEAEALYRQILGHDPNHADSLHLLGFLAHQIGRSDAAVDLIGKAIHINGNAAPYHSNLGLALTVLGRLDEAVAAYQAGLRINPNLIEARFNLGVALSSMKRFHEAIDAHQAVLRIKPDFAPAYFHLGLAFKECRRLDEAIGAFIAATRLDPNHADAQANLGLALNELGRLDEAVAAYREALRVRPAFAEVHYNLGITLASAGRLDDAVAAYAAALRVRPELAEASYNMGNALKSLRRLEDAIAAYEAALRIRPGYPEAHANLGLALTEVGRLNDAVAAFASALTQKPDYAKAHYNLGNALLGLGKVEDAIAAYRAALNANPGLLEAHGNLVMAMNYSPNHTGSEILLAARGYAARLGRPTSARIFNNTLDPGRRLRVGYVSGDFKSHPVGYFLARVMEAHSPDRVEVTCYSNNPRADAMTGRLRAAASHWRVISGRSDEAVEEMVRVDGIDILIDLAGHTDLNRLPLFARRAAPVQATWLGYFGTTGLNAMDYIIADNYVAPPGDEACFTETVVRLPHSRFCYDPVADAPEVAPSPFTRAGRITFGSFNQLAKLTPEVARLWARIINAVPESRLLIKAASLDDPGARAIIAARFTEVGLPADRLELRGKSALLPMLAEYGDIDIALDPFPFSGGTTSCEALWMGVPVVSMPGATMVSRQTASFLATIGIPTLIAHGPDHYVEIATTLAASPDELIRLRQGLRGMMSASPLMDGPGFTRNVENAYRWMWEQWCAARR